MTLSFEFRDCNLSPDSGFFSSISGTRALLDTFLHLSELLEVTLSIEFRHLNLSLDSSTARNDSCFSTTLEMTVALLEMTSFPILLSKIKIGFHLLYRFKLLIYFVQHQLFCSTCNGTKLLRLQPIKHSTLNGPKHIFRFRIE